jgi:hypothetical protein
LSQDGKQKNEANFTVSSEEWDKRTLCKDESCIGVIGKDGRCKECGLEFGPGWSAPEPGDGPPAAATSENEVAVENDQPQEIEDDASDDTGEPDKIDENDDWSKRTLCKDESCIGVIGPDGRCKECGLPYKD